MDDKHDEVDDDAPTEIIDRATLEAARNLKDSEDDAQEDDDDPPTN